MRIHQLFIVVVLTLPSTLFAATRLVETDGSDIGNCIERPCRTMSHAIARASEGDVIRFGAGQFYFGDVVAKSVVLRGIQAGVDARGRTGVPETILSGDILITSPGLVVDGFTFECDGCGVAISAEPGARIINNRIHGGVAQISLYAGRLATTEIRFNEFLGVPIASGPIMFPMKTIGLAISGYGDDPRADVVVDSNRFSGSSQSLVTMSGLVAANEISFTNNELIVGTARTGLDISNVDGIRIAGNSISGAQATAEAVQIEKSRNVLFIRNLVSDSDSAVVVRESDGLRVESNTFRHNTRALAIGANVEVHSNRFSENYVDIEALSSVVVDARNNWLGCNAGPSECAVLRETNGTILASPWLVMSVTASPSEIARTRPSIVTVDLNHNSDGTFVPGFPDGARVEFTAASTDFGPSGGTVMPEFSVTSLGVASTTFTADAVGQFRAYAHLDEEEVFVTILTRNPRRRAAGN